GDTGDEAESLGPFCDRGEHRPREPGMSLAVQARVEVITDLDEVETGLFGPDCLLHDVSRTVSFREQFVANLHLTPPVFVGVVVRLSRNRPTPRYECCSPSPER